MRNCSERPRPRVPAGVYHGRFDKKTCTRELNAGNFRDIAYFEPFYLKDFVATVGKKLF